MIHTLADDFRPFDELLQAAGGTVPEEMPPFPDVPEGLDRITSRGHRLAVLTNRARDTGESQLQRAGSADRFEQVIGVDEVSAYKPDGRAYAYVLDDLGATAQNLPSA